MSNLRVSLLQSEIQWEKRKANLDFYSNFINNNLKEPTDIIILPEMFTSGFTMNVKQCHDSMDGETIQWMRQMSSQYHTAICGSVIIKEEEFYYNRFLWVDAMQNHVLIYDKKHLFCLAQEDHFYKAGNEKLLIEYKGWKIAPYICYDLRFPVWMRNVEQADLQIVVANFPAKRRTAWNGLLPARAIENQCYLAGVNRIGVDGIGIEYTGDSNLYNYEGEALFANQSEATIQTATLDKNKLDIYRRAYPFLKDRDLFRFTDN